MTKKSISALVARRPFRPLEVRMVDGQRIRLTHLEQFIVGRESLAVMTQTGTLVHFSLGLISAIRPIPSRRRRA